MTSLNLTAGLVEARRKRNFLRFLDGKQAEIEKNLEDRMESCSKHLKFEKAKELRDRLFALRFTLMKRS